MGRATLRQTLNCEAGQLSCIHKWQEWKYLPQKCIVDAGGLEAKLVLDADIEMRM